MIKKRLIVIEGTDGCGKQTQTELLHKYLVEKGIDTRKISFPDYESDTSALVRMYLCGQFGDNAEDVPPKIASTFYALDRYGSYKSKWGKDYNNGTVIVSDRYIGSNMIHQGSKLKGIEQMSFLSWLYSFEHYVLELPKETLTIFLDMPTEYTKQLMENRPNKITNEDVKDIHERDKTHLYKAYNTACSVAKAYGWKIVKCYENGHIRSIEDIHRDIVDLVEVVL